MTVARSTPNNKLFYVDRYLVWTATYVANLAGGVRRVAGWLGASPHMTSEMKQRHPETASWSGAASFEQVERSSKEERSL